MSHPLRNLAAYEAEGIVAAVDAFLSLPASVLSCEVSDLISIAGPENLRGVFIHAALPNKPTLGDAIEVSQGKDNLEIAGRFVKHLAKANRYRQSVQTPLKLASKFTVHRPILGFQDDEPTLLRGLAQCAEDGRMPAYAWVRALALLTWNNGNSYLEPDPSIDGHHEMPHARATLTTFLKGSLPDAQTVLTDLGRMLGQYAATPVRQGGRTQSNASPFASGARWMTRDDLISNPVFSLEAKPSSLLIGYEPDQGEPVYFNGHESLISIGGAGSGKTQSQVIPNLLRFPGSCIVLDVKGELWDSTAGYRQKNYGPVFKFQPTSKTGETHRYNPFDFISTEPAQAAEDCAVLSYQVVLENANAKEPYWENRSRDYLWAYAVMVAIKNAPKHRTIGALAECYNWPQSNSPGSDIVQLAKSMVRNGDRHGVADLKSAGRSIINGLGDQRLDSTFDNARTQLAPFTRSPSLTYALSTSDWRPEMLRTRPGTTIYLCLSVDELKSYASVVRVLLAQHANVLMRYRADPKEPPITLFLDEMPQLGNFDAIAKLQDVGRGAGLRLWMFAQSLGQMHKAFGHERYKGIVDGCIIRCWMNPDQEAAEKLVPVLGESQRLFSRKASALASVSDLMGTAYGQKIITMSRANHPASLDRKYAYEEEPEKFLQPPVVRRSGVP